MNGRLESASIHGSGLSAGKGLLLGVGIVAAALLGGCSTSMAPSAPPVALVSVTTTDLVGSWGLAAYRVEKDIARTEAEARRACSNPYVIGSGTSGGVTMHLADQSTPQEVFLKTSSDGRVFIGPQGKPGDRRDRQVISYGNGILVTQWVDPDAATRYGTMVFVRCGGA